MIEASNFIEEFINEDLAEGKVETVHTRFPPEPNGYLHIGHCKALVIDFGTAKKYGGLCNLRMDDTNPAKEDTEYVDAIKEDIHWLGFDWGDRFFYGSDYFEKDYEYAVELIKKGLAYVCELTADQMEEYRGDLTHPARSPWRERPIEESLDLFERMKNGEFPDGKYTLRAKIDLESGNFWMRDPVIYRIKHASHHRYGTKWCIYPTYDFAHPIQDALEGITHSLCSLEFEIHRPLYNWVVEHVSVPSKPRQIEFARLNITYTVLSKRFLRSLVESGKVDGWDDPRMPTLRGLRRRGFTGESIVDFITKVGVSKADSLVDIRFLDACIRDELNEIAPRRVAVLNPIKVVVDNYPEGKEEFFELPNHPQKPEMGTRKLKFTREIYIDAEDFAEVPPPKFFRMKPDGEVRLMGGYIVKCTGVEKNPDGTIKEIHCTADLETGNGNPADGRKIKGTIHWLSASDAIDSTVILYNNLLTLEEPSKLPEGKEYSDYLNPESRIVLEGCKLEPSLADAKPGEKFQFVRTGYFCVDTKEPGVFNRTVTLKDGFKPAK
ncbi:MAG: glutamine--tRNA ligase/YqeY domain fusion protein [Eubacteriales bacterium]|nr:glutamine--tRNA ligase/YqeY domain fusion protein [Clostridiales bacterium]MDD7300534.1 glutamine--tRNA ligase/YqeY domain fusion protein [Eubacteriales bacterium]